MSKLFRKTKTFGKKKSAKQKSAISLGIMRESEFIQGVIATVMKTADQHRILKLFSLIVFFTS
jgi:hypothetical protein